MNAEMWEAQREYGFWQFVLDPVTQERRSLFINSRFAEQCGFHKEEMLARLANYEAEVPRPEIDTLRIFLDDFNHLLDDSLDAPIERCVHLQPNINLPGYFFFFFFFGYARLHATFMHYCCR